jgi:hypothetical protein
MARRKPDPVVREYTRNFAELFLKSIATSEEYQSDYGELSPALKARTSQQMARIADRLTDRLLRYENPGDQPLKVMRKLIRESIEDDSN